MINVGLLVQTISDARTFLSIDDGQFVRHSWHYSQDKLTDTRQNYEAFLRNSTSMKAITTSASWW